MPIDRYAYGKTLLDISTATAASSGSSILTPNFATTVCAPYAYQSVYDGTFSGLNQAQLKVSTLGRMQSNWDGYGAEAIGSVTSANTTSALNVLSYQLPVPDITPNSNGTLSLEWETSAGAAHLEIGRTTCSLYVQPTASSQAYYFSGTPQEIDGRVGALLYGSLYAPLEPPASVNQIGGRKYGR